MGGRLLLEHLDIVSRTEVGGGVTRGTIWSVNGKGRNMIPLKALRRGAFRSCLYRDSYAVSPQLMMRLGMLCLHKCVMLANGEDFSQCYPTGYTQFSKAF